MVRNRRRWRYRDPSWPQIGLLYLLAIIFTIYSSPPRIAYALVFASFTTVLVVIKVVRNSAPPPNEDGR